MSKKILILIPYFGKLPVYFPLFLQSVRENPNLDFLFLYDGEIRSDILPANFTLRHFTKEQFNELATEKLGFAIQLKNPYKLCDFKTLYGFLWQEQLKDYDYWGTSDIDLVLGDTRGFLKDILVVDYDVINLREDYFAASFFLMKNTEKCINLFRLKNGWEDILKKEMYSGFDEYSYMDNLPVEINRWSYSYPFPNMSSIVYDAEKKGEIVVYKKKIIKESIQHDEVLLVDGKTISSLKTNETFFHYHFVIEKMNKALFRYPSRKTVSDKYYVTPAGFFDYYSFRYKKVLRITQIRIAVNKFVYSPVLFFFRGTRKVFGLVKVNILSIFKNKK